MLQRLTEKAAAGASPAACNRTELAEVAGRLVTK
jgi:hypothetical protein